MILRVNTYFQCFFLPKIVINFGDCNPADSYRRVKSETYRLEISSQLIFLYPILVSILKKHSLFIISQ